MPLMKELGILWQTGAISPSHEHFITNLIKQKIHIQTERLQRNQSKNECILSLFCFYPKMKFMNWNSLFKLFNSYQKGSEPFFRSIDSNLKLKTLSAYDILSIL